MRNATLALVDDHPVLLRGLGDILNEEGNFSVIASGGSSKDATEIAMRDRPDVLIMDLNMPGNAFEAISLIVERAPETKVIAFTAATGTDVAVKALEAGASGYLVKGSTTTEVKGAIAAVLRGETYISQEVAFKVISALRTSTTRGNKVRLSKREEQVLRLLMSGKTNREIAASIGIGEKTVKHYMTILMQKLQAKNRIEAVIAAQSLDLSRQPTANFFNS
jgi:DNA-binding NarL/FixJ family response regulator